MPTYVVKRTGPLLVSVTVEAADPAEARRAALEAWMDDAKNEAALAEPELVGDDR